VRVAGRVATHTVFHPPVAAQRVALAALESGSAWVDDARRAYRDARDATVEALAGTGVGVARPAGGSYAFLDFTAALHGRPLRLLLERAIDHGVLLAPGDGCGAAFGSWARLCFTAVSPPRLQMGLERLKTALASFV
jgi:aspartate/methionine/tyrosine aminotransferase